MSAVLSRRCLKIQAQLNQAYRTVTCVALRIQHRGSPCAMHVQPQARQAAGRCCWVQTVWVQLLMNTGGGRLVSEGVLVAPIVVLKPWWLCRVGSRHRLHWPAGSSCAHQSFSLLLAPGTCSAGRVDLSGCWKINHDSSCLAVMCCSVPGLGTSGRTTQFLWAALSLLSLHGVSTLLLQ